MWYLQLFHFTVFWNREKAIEHLSVYPLKPWFGISVCFERRGNKPVVSTCENIHYELNCCLGDLDLKTSTLKWSNQNEFGLFNDTCHVSHFLFEVQEKWNHWHVYFSLISVPCSIQKPTCTLVYGRKFRCSRKAIVLCWALHTLNTWITCTLRNMPTSVTWQESGWNRQKTVMWRSWKNVSLWHHTVWDYRTTPLIKMLYQTCKCKVPSLDNAFNRSSCRSFEMIRELFKMRIIVSIKRDWVLVQLFQLLLNWTN